MRIKELASLHKRVIHDEIFGHKGKCELGTFDNNCLVCLEDKWIKAYPDDSLESVCYDCFHLHDLGTPSIHPSANKQPSDLNSEQLTTAELINNSLKCIVFGLICKCKNRYQSLPTSFLVHHIPGKWQPWYQLESEVVARGFTFTA